MSEINNLLITINNHAKENSKFSRSLEIEAYKAIQKVQHSVADRFSEGYCMTFKTPETEVIGLFMGIHSIDAKTLHDAFVADWALPSNAIQLRATYYHSSMLLFAYAVMHKNERLAEAAIALSLFRMWNGRRHTLIKFCNPDIMAYVVSNMMTKQYLPTKFSTPYDMIIKHFAPTIMKKYTPYVRRDSGETKRVIQQVFKRIEQVFKSGSAPNLQTGNTRYTSGLMPLYFKAAEEGYKISQTTVYGKGDNGPTVDEVFSSHDYESITQDTVHSIVINHNPKYPNDFKRFIKKESGNVKQTIIDILMVSIYTNKFNDHLVDIVSLMLKRMDAPKSIICSDSFYVVVKKMIVSSKHNSEVNQIKAVVDNVLTTVFSMNFSVPSDYNAWSKMSKAQFRKIIIYCIAYNISRSVCK